MNTIINIGAFVVLTGLWLAFGAALIWHREFLDMVWRSFRSMNVLIQVCVALLVLPVVVGLAIWQTRWPVWLRLVLVAGLAWMTVYTFLPQVPA